MKKNHLAYILIGLAALILMAVAVLWLYEPAPDAPDEETLPSLVVPGKSHFGASKEYLLPESGEIKAGDNLTFRLLIEKNKEAIMNETINVSRVNEVYSDEELPLPEGMNITCNPSAFLSYPGKSYNVSLTFVTTEETPEGVYHFRVQRHFDSGIATLWVDLHVAAPDSVH